MPTGSNPSSRLAVALAYEGLCTFEFSIAVEIFGLPRPEFGRDWYRFAVCGVDAGPLSATGGIKVLADGGLELLTEADTIIVPGWKGLDVPGSPALIDALVAAYDRGARLLSICSGVFLLAQTGLIDGRRATTHWRYTDVLAERHPEISVDANVLYVDNGNVLTSAGSAAGIDLCLHLVRRDFGADRANQVARRLVLPPHRDGGQAQFVDRPMPRTQDSETLGQLFDWMRHHLGEPLPISRLCGQVSMSRRTFLRRFQEVCGQNPGQWLVAERLRRARELLETTQWDVERIAQDCGFGSAATLRHHFRERLATTPTAYRGQFAR